MKQLFKHYQKVKAKADPDNWNKAPIYESKKSLVLAGQTLPDNYFKTIGEYKDEDGTAMLEVLEWTDTILEYNYRFTTRSKRLTVDKFGMVVIAAQKEVLEIENLLYGYWERNVRPKDYEGGGLGMEYLLVQQIANPLAFNDWLAQQLTDLG